MSDPELTHPPCDVGVNIEVIVKDAVHPELTLRLTYCCRKHYPQHSYEDLTFSQEGALAFHKHITSVVEQIKDVASRTMHSPEEKPS